MAVRTKRTPNKSSGKMSDLAKAAASRGRDSGNVVANQVIDRIVNNSTQEFQNYLAQAGRGTAMANASAAITNNPTPFGMPSQAEASMRLEPPPFGSTDALMADLMGGGMPDPTGMPLQPPPYGTPPALMPTYSPPVRPMSPLPPMPSLVPNQPSPVGREMEALLRSVGLL